MNAATISRKLRSLGFAPVAPADYMREGLKVRQSYDTVSVTADFDLASEAKRMTAEARDALIEAGFRVERKSSECLHVLGRD